MPAQRLIKPLVLSFALAAASCSTTRLPPVPEPRVEYTLQKVAFQIGDTQIHAVAHQVGTRTLTMVNVHDDEQTSVEAAHAVLEKYGGRLIELVHTGKRRVVFSLDDRAYSIDPNRIFSEAGVRKTVRGEGLIPEEAYAAVNRFAAQFVRHFGLDREPALIALHNNGDGGFSIRSYLPGAEYELDTDEIYVNPAADPDDFYYVTEKRFFDELRRRKFNVILQDNRILRDDGSLSVFAGRRSIPYINVEAQDDHLDEQIRMLEIAVQIMR